MSPDSQVRCPLHWNLLQEGRASGHGQETLSWRRPGLKEAEPQVTPAKPRPLYLRLRLAVPPGGPCPQVHVPRKHKQSVMSRSKCKHTSHSSTGCSADDYLEIDWWRWLGWGCSFNQTVWQLCTERKVRMAQQHWEGFWLSNI